MRVAGPVGFTDAFLIETDFGFINGDKNDDTDYVITENADAYYGRRTVFSHTS